MWGTGWATTAGAGAALALLGAAYDAAVDSYAARKTERMSRIPLNLHARPDGADGGSSAGDDVRRMSANDLRSTVSRRSGLVEDLDDRRAWNAWIATMMASTHSARGATTGDGGVGSSPPTTPPLLTPGSYTFMYRTYVNSEEANALRKSLFSARAWLGYIQPRRGTMVVHPDGRRVVIEDHFLHRVVKPMSIRWNGVLEAGGGRIVWTDTEMTVGRKRTVKNPEASEKLRKIPWDVVGVDNGMAVFRRGDIGVLVYDQNTC